MRSSFAVSTKGAPAWISATATILRGGSAAGHFAVSMRT
jgi:hypothetical protein